MIELLLFEDVGVFGFAARRKEDDFRISEMEVEESIFPRHSIECAVDHLAYVAVADEEDIAVFMF